MLEFYERYNKITFWWVQGYKEEAVFTSRVEAERFCRENNLSLGQVFFSEHTVNPTKEKYNVV